LKLAGLLHFCADRIEQAEKLGLLTQNPAQSQKTLNSKLVANFLNFPFITQTLKSDKHRRSYDHYNLGVLLKIYFWTDQATWTNLDFKPTSIGELKDP
jgi:hypothetical protein